MKLTQMLRTMWVSIMVVTLIMLALWQASEYGDNDIPGYEETCQEDEACWDCATMGNLICGE